MSINLDELKSFLTEVQAGATEDPAAFATTAITHFNKLLSTAIVLAGAVEKQTQAIKRLLEEELATVSTPPMAVQGPATVGQPQFVPYPVYVDQNGRPVQMNPAPPVYPQPQTGIYTAPAGGWVQQQAAPQSAEDYQNPALLAAQQQAQQMHQNVAVPPLPGMWEGGKSVRRDRV